MQSSFFTFLFLLMSVLSMVFFQAALGFHLWSSPFLHFSFSLRGKSFLWVTKGLALGGTVVKNLLANAEGTRDWGSIPGLGRSPGVGNCSPLQYSCLGNPMNRGAWQAAVHGGAESWTRLSNWPHSPEEKNIRLPLVTGGKGLWSTSGSPYVPCHSLCP